jgi:hypothetical protein
MVSDFSNEILEVEAIGNLLSRLVDGVVDLLEIDAGRDVE